MEIKTSKGTFIVTTLEQSYILRIKVERIGLVSDILKDEELSCKIVDENKAGLCEDYLSNRVVSGVEFKYPNATDSFQSLCNKYELKETDLLIRKL